MTVGELKEYLEAVPDSHDVWFRGENGVYGANVVQIRCPWELPDGQSEGEPRLFIGYVHRYREAR